MTCLLAASRALCWSSRYKLTNVAVLKCYHGIVHFFQVWTDPLSNFSQQDFNTVGVRTILIWSFLVPLFTLTRVAPNIPHNSGSKLFSSGEAKLKGMIIGSILNVKSFFKWASSVDLTLHLSQHNSDGDVVQVMGYLSS